VLEMPPALELRSVLELSSALDLRCVLQLTSPLEPKLTPGLANPHQARFLPDLIDLLESQLVLNSFSAPTRKYVLDPLHVFEFRYQHELPTRLGPARW
jgi:hypothetical protein